MYGWISLYMQRTHIHSEFFSGTNAFKVIMIIFGEDDYIGCHGVGWCYFRMAIKEIIYSVVELLWLLLHKVYGMFQLTPTHQKIGTPGSGTIQISVLFDPRKLTLTLNWCDLFTLLYQIILSNTEHVSPSRQRKCSDIEIFPESFEFSARIVRACEFRNDYIFWGFIFYDF